MQVIGSLSPLKPRSAVASFSPQTKDTEVVTAVPEPLTPPVPVSITPTQEAAPKPVPAASESKSAVDGGDGDEPVHQDSGGDVKATAIAITADSPNKMATPASGSLALPTMLYINNATPVTDGAADCAAENMPLIKAENVDVETKQQSQLASPQPRAEDSTALGETTPAAESSPPKLASAGNSVNSAELLPAVAVVVNVDMPTSTVLQASISTTPPLRVSAEPTDKDAPVTPVTPAAIAVADVTDGDDSKQAPSTTAKPCATTATSAVWSTPATAPPATFPSSDSTTAISAAVAAAEAGAAVQREQQQYAELRADALNAAAQSASRPDARTPLSLGNFETKLQLDPMSLFSGLSGMGSSALFASQTLTGAALHPANVTEAQLLANQLRATGTEPAPKANGLFTALGGMSAEDYSRSVDLLRNLAAQQHLALLSGGAAPNGTSLRDAEAVRQAHNTAILFPTNTSSSNANPFTTPSRAGTAPPANSCEATTAKAETAKLTQPTALPSISIKPPTSSLDTTSASEEAKTASIVSVADATITRGTITTTPTTTATVGSTVTADPIAGTLATEAATTTPQYPPGRTLTRDELFLAVQAKQFALLRASLLANAANATNGTNSPINAAARSLSIPKVIATDSKGPNPAVSLSEMANIDATSESVTNMLASAMKLLNNDPGALLDFSKATTKERTMLLRTINLQINRTNQVCTCTIKTLIHANVNSLYTHTIANANVYTTYSPHTPQLPGKMPQNRRLPANLQSVQSMLSNGAHNRFGLMGRNQLPFGDHYNVLFERAQGRAFAATGAATPQRQHTIFGERGAGHAGADPLSIHMAHNNAAAVAAGMHMTSPANTTFSRHVAAGLGMKPVMYGAAGNQSTVGVPGAMRATTIAPQQQQVVPGAPGEAKSVKDAKRRAKRPRPQPQPNNPATLETQKKPKKDTDGDEEDEDESPVGWVQCNRCKEWRQLPRNIDAESLPDQWFCKVTPRA